MKMFFGVLFGILLSIIVVSPVKADSNYFEVYGDVFWEYTTTPAQYVSLHIQWEWTTTDNVVHYANYYENTQSIGHYSCLVQLAGTLKAGTAIKATIEDAAPYDVPYPHGILGWWNVDDLNPIPGTYYTECPVEVGGGGM